MIFNNLFFFQYFIFFILISITLLKSNKEIFNIIIIAFLLRAVILLFSDYLPLLDLRMSSIWEEKSFEFAQRREYEGHVVGEPMYYYSVWASYIYEYIGRIPLLLKLIGVLAGTINCILIYHITLKVWKSTKGARLSLLISATYPIMINYSVLTMREVFIALTLLLQIYFFVLYYEKYKTNEPRIIFLITSISFNYFHFRLHGALEVVAILLFFMAIYLELDLKKRFLNYQKPFFIYKLFMVLVISLFCIYITIEQLLPYIPYLNELNIESIKKFHFSNIILKWNLMQTGGAAYPSYLIPTDTNAAEFFLLIPIRIIYFLCAPFFWEVSKAGHIIAYLDSLVYTLIIFVIIVNFKKILKNEIIFFLLLIVITMVFIFSMGSGNFGSAMRHRTKFLPIFIIICSPFLLNFYNQLNDYINKKFKK